MKRAGPATAIIVIAVVAVTFFAWRWQRSDQESNSSVLLAPAAAGTHAAASPVVSAANDAPAAAPNLLEIQAWKGTDADGDIHLDSAGHVITDLALREWFDYLLSAGNQLDLPQITQRLKASAKLRHLTDSQTAELEALFARYVDYLKAVADIPVESTDPAGLQRLYDARYRLRRSQLGEVMASGFFADSEAQDRYVLAELAITQDKTLSAAQRAQRLAAAQALAPASTRDAEARASALAELNAGEAALRQQGADAAQLQALRERTVGPEAAERLRAVDEEDAAWNQRVQAFEAARRSIERNTGLSPEDRRQQRDALIARDFSEPEALRLRAMLGITP